MRHPLLLASIFHFSVRKIFQSIPFHLFDQFQLAYLHVDNVTLNFNREYINMTYSAKNTPPDYKVCLLSYEVVNFVELLKVQSRVKIYLANDAKDEDSSHKIFQSSIDKCKLYEGVQATFFTRAWQENTNKRNGSALSCPIPKGFHNKVVNLTISDTFMIPMPTEKLLRINIKDYAVIKGKKGWTFLWEQTTLGRYRKTILK